MNDFPSLPPQPAFDERAQRRQFAEPALAISFIFLSTLIVQLILVLLIQQFAPHLTTQSWYTIAVSMTPMYLIGMPLSLLFYRSSASEPPEQKKLGVLPFLGLVAICFVLTYLGNILGNLINIAIGNITGKQPVNDLQELTLSTPFWATLLFTGILAPVMEELFYRKLVIDRLRRYGDLPALLISGLVFGLLHGNFYQLFYASLMGFVFGFIYLRTGRIRYTIALHMLINLIGGVYASEVVKRLDLEALAQNSLEYVLQNPVPILMLLAQMFFIGICFVAAPIALVFLWKHIRFERAQIPLTPRQWYRVALRNPAVWLLALTLTALFFL